MKMANTAVAIARIDPMLMRGERGADIVRSRHVQAFPRAVLLVIPVRALPGSIGARVGLMASRHRIFASPAAKAIDGACFLIQYLMQRSCMRGPTKNAALLTVASPSNLVAVGRKLDRIHNCEAARGALHTGNTLWKN
jgi:hypothetical protein